MSKVTKAASVALDLGVLMTKVAIARGGADPLLVSAPTAAGSSRDFISVLLADAEAKLSGRLGSVCFVVPDAWLDADVDGGYACEEFRHLVEDEMGLGDLTWIGQAEAVTAAASARACGGDGEYLVCDIGGSGVRTAVCEVADHEIQFVTGHMSAGGGWQEFSARALDAAGGGEDAGAGDWLASVRQQRRLALVLDRAVVDSGYLDTPACSATTPNGSYSLTGGQLIESFAPTAERLRAGISAVLDRKRPAVTVLTGGLGWFPLAAKAVAEATGVMPSILEPDAAAAGALLIGRGATRLAPVSLPQVRLPVHQVRNGLLEEDRLELPWTRSFASLGGEPLVLDSGQVPLEISGRPRIMVLPDLASGSYQVGVRPGNSRCGLLVLRSAGPGSGQAIYISPLDLEN